jgi:hypothetical protein
MEKDAAVGSVVFGAADCADFADAALQGRGRVPNTMPSAKKSA